ncbi:MAG: glycosyltransferase involved in cell wall biosynthesis [Arenicella sp.]
MIKIVHLVPRDAIGGVESAARSMLNATGLQCEFSLIFIEHEYPRMRNGGDSIPVLQSENNPIAHFRALKQIISIKPNLLLCSLWRSVPAGIFFKLLRPRAKLVFFLHCPTTTHLLDRLFSKLMMCFCDAVWADSEATISSRVGTSQKFVKRVISFVTSSNPLEIKKNKLAPRFVFWGRLHYLKGLDRALNFIKLLIERDCSATFEIWGPDGGELSSLSLQIERAGLKNTVMLKGTASPDNLDQIAEGNCFYLQLSRNEGMAMSVVEAMQRSLVPIVTAVGEIRAYCQQAHNAIVVNDPDHPKDAVDDVIALLNDEAMYRRLQAAAHDHWAQYVLYKDDICAAANELCKPS